MLLTDWGPDGVGLRAKGLQMCGPAREASSDSSESGFLLNCYPWLGLSIFLYLRCFQKSCNCLDPTQVQAFPIAYVLIFDNLWRGKVSVEGIRCFIFVSGLCGSFH